jgi:hypothetical protein
MMYAILGFQLVKSVLSDNAASLPATFSEKIIIDCARELFDNSDSGDMNQGLLKQAIEW